MPLDAASLFADGYPADRSHPDYAVQAIIDGEIRNCQSLAGSPHAHNGLLYPAYFAADPSTRAAWLEPALRRFLWNAGRRPWDLYLRRFLQLLISPSNPTPSEPVLLLMAQAGPQLETRDAQGCDVAGVVAPYLARRKQPLTPEWIDALQALVAHLVSIHSHGHATFELAWRLWRAPENARDGGPCFSAHIRSGLRAMAADEAAAWSAFLDLRNCDPSRRNLDPAYTADLCQAVARIGKSRFISRWSGWIEALAAQQPAVLSAPGRDLLLLFLHASAADAALPTDELLYRLCSVRWAGAKPHDRLTPEWLGALVTTLATRLPQRAFSCVEALVQNPDTTAFVEVHKLYDQLLAETADEAVDKEETAGESAPSPQHQGVDGYHLNLEPDLYRHHVILDRFLRDSLPGVPHAASGAYQTTWHSEQMLPLLVRRQAAGDHAGFLRAIAARTRWIARVHQPPPVALHQTPLGEVAVRPMDPSLFWRAALTRLQHNLLAAAPVMGSDDLLTAIEADLAGASCGGGAELFTRISEHIRRHGYSLPLVRMIERWRDAQHGSNSALHLRHNISWLLWFEDVAPIDEKDCWSQCIRKDLRRMTPARRRAWLAILENNTTARVAKPPAAWNGKARSALAAVPAAEFRSSLRAWFAPLREPQPLHLTVCGRDVLRNLMWYALLAKDPQVDEAVSWFAHARWRNRQDRSCAETNLPAFFHVMKERSEPMAFDAFEALHARNVEFRGKLFALYQEIAARLGRTPSIAPPHPPPAHHAPDPGQLILMMLHRSVPDADVALDGDRLIVHGTRHTYEMGLYDSSIIRKSDGRSIRLELDFSQRAFAMLRPMLDSQDLNHPFKPNPVRITFCARILLHDEINAQFIAAD